jgi:hypothetical protein
VVYNWGVTGYVGGHSEAPHYADVIGNYFIKGPSSSDHFVGEITATDNIYQTGNYFASARDGTLDGRPAVPADFGPATLVSGTTQSPQVPVTIDTAKDAYQKVIAGAGDSAHRDAIDKRLIQEVQSLGKDGAIIHDPKDVGGFGELQTAAVAAPGI